MGIAVHFVRTLASLLEENQISNFMCTNFDRICTFILHFLFFFCWHWKLNFLFACLKQREHWMVILLWCFRLGLWGMRMNGTGQTYYQQEEVWWDPIHLHLICPRLICRICWVRLQSCQGLQSLLTMSCFQKMLIQTINLLVHCPENKRQQSRMVATFHSKVLLVFHKTACMISWKTS